MSILKVCSNEITRQTYLRLLVSATYVVKFYLLLLIVWQGICDSYFFINCMVFVEQGFLTLLAALLDKHGCPDDLGLGYRIPGIH